jgi:hypothetical protein
MQYKVDNGATVTVVGNWIRDFSYAVFDGKDVKVGTEGMRI